MAEKKPVEKGPPKAANEAKSFTDEELAAMREHTQELKAGQRVGKADGENEARKANAPSLSPKAWYGMPAYPREGQVVCFFQSAQNFKTRYATPGFREKASLDEGCMWPTAFALKELTDEDAEKVAALVKKAVS